MTPLRSLLFIPGDSEKKLAKADETGADALIFDLEDSVAQASKPEARARVAATLRARPPGARRSQLWVRVNPLGTSLALEDLTAVMPAAPDGIMLPKAAGPEDVRRLSYYLDAFEAACGAAPGSVRILPVATETAIAPFYLADYAGAGLTRLLGLTWGAEDLSADLGASTNQAPEGGLEFTYRMVRSMTLLGARAAGVQAIDTLHADFRDEAGLRASSRAARAEGFTGRLAIHPAQVAAINESFMPSAGEIDHASRVVEAFASAPGAGVVGLDGKMLDRPHLRAAEAVLATAKAYDRSAG